MELFKTIIIGGGASGLFLARQLKSDYLIVEANDRVGKKLLATGNGKCNLLNENLSSDFYNNPKFVDLFISKFSKDEILNKFLSFGLLTKEMDKKIYPYSESAFSVLDILRKDLNILCNAVVKKIERVKDYFQISLNDGRKLFSKNVVLATGSNASFGKDSINLYKDFGHTFKKFIPSLCPILTDRESVKGLNGVRVKATLNYGKHFERGEILFKDYGISGIASFNISSYIARGEKGELFIDFMPDYLLEDILKLFKGDVTSEKLKGVLHSRIAERLLERGDIINSIKHYKVGFKGLADMSQAQVSSGGLNVLEFDKNLESKKQKGLFALGEVLDVDGLCGGYNLGWCWLSALAVAEKIME